MDVVTGGPSNIELQGGNPHPSDSEQQATNASLSKACEILIQGKQLRSRLGLLSSAVQARHLDNVSKRQLR